MSNSPQGVLYTPGYPGHIGGGVAPAFKQSGGGGGGGNGGGAAVGYLHAKDLVQASAAAMVPLSGGHVYVPAADKLGQGKDQSPAVSGQALMFWMRLNDYNPTAGSYWYNNPVFGWVSSADSDPWLSVKINAQNGSAANCAFSISGPDYGATFLSSALSGSKGIFGADGQSPVLNKWYFVVVSYAGSNSNTGNHVTMVDEDGNISHSGYVATGHRPYSDYGHTGQRVHFCGSTSVETDSRDKRTPMDICQARVYWWESVAGAWSKPLGDDTYFSSGDYLKSYDPLVEAPYLVSGWVPRAYWSLNNILTVDPAYNSLYDLVLGTDGELVESGGPALV